MLQSILAAGSLSPTILIVVVVAVILVFSLFLVMLSRYRRCPSDKIMVIYGKVGQNKDGTARSAKCIHGGAAMVWPVMQDYEYMDLTPMSLSVDLKSALSRQNIRIDVPARFTVAISTEPGTMQNAAERLLGLKAQEIQELAKDIIFGQMRLIIATMQIDELLRLISPMQFSFHYRSRAALYLNQFAFPFKLSFLSTSRMPSAV